MFLIGTVDLKWWTSELTCALLLHTLPTRTSMNFGKRHVHVFYYSAAQPLQRQQEIPNYAFDDIH